MLGFKKRDRASDIETALQQNWIEFAAAAAFGLEATIVLRAEGTVPDDIHYALRAEMRDHVVDMIKRSAGEKLTLSDAEIRTLAHRIQSRAVERLEESHKELMVETILTAGTETGLFVDPIGERLRQAMP
jgi:hypothetical protein